MKYALSPKTHLEQSIFNLYNSLNIWNPHEIDLELISESCHIEITKISGRSQIMTRPARSGWMLRVDASLDENDQREKSPMKFVIA
jgi:hypothetical protein